MDEMRPYPEAVVDLFGMNGVSWVGVGSYLMAVLSLVAFFVRDCKRLD